MDKKLAITQIEISHGKFQNQRHKRKEQYELEEGVKDSYESQINEYERQKQELKLRKKQENLANVKFWERQIEEKKLLSDLDKLEEKQLKERLNKFEEMKQRRMQEEPSSRQAMLHGPLTEVNIGQVLKKALRDEQTRVRAINARRDAEDAGKKREDEIRATRNRRFNDHALQIMQAKQSKPKQPPLKEKQDSMENARGSIRRDTGVLPWRVSAPQKPGKLSCAYSRAKPSSRKDGYEQHFYITTYNLHFTFSRR